MWQYGCLYGMKGKNLTKIEVFHIDIFWKNKS